MDNRQLTRLVVGAVVLLVIFGLSITLIALVLFGQDLYGRATAFARLDPALRGATGSRNVIVVLGFMPDRFHNERVAEYGVFASDVPGAPLSGSSVGQGWASAVPCIIASTAPGRSFPFCGLFESP